ncbi:hypothetical protein ACHAXS_011436 [Conticribra weissflogii]
MATTDRSDISNQRKGFQIFRRQSTSKTKHSTKHLKGSGFQDTPSSERAEPTLNATTRKSRGLQLSIPTITFIRSRKNSETKGDKRLWRKVSFRAAGASPIVSKRNRTSQKKHSSSEQSFDSSFNEIDECDEGMEYYDAEQMSCKNTFIHQNYFGDVNNRLSKVDSANIDAKDTNGFEGLRFNIFQCYLPIEENASLEPLPTSNHDFHTARECNRNSKTYDSAAGTDDSQYSRDFAEDKRILQGDSVQQDHDRSDTVCRYCVVWSILVIMATAEALFIRGYDISNEVPNDFRNEDDSSCSFEVVSSKAQIDGSKDSPTDSYEEKISTPWSHDDDDESSIPSLSTSSSNSRSPEQCLLAINDNGESDPNNIAEITISMGSFMALVGSTYSLFHKHYSEIKRRSTIHQRCDDSLDMMSLPSDEDSSTENDSIVFMDDISSHLTPHQEQFVTPMNAGSNQINIADSVISFSALMTLLGSHTPEAVRKRLNPQNQPHNPRSIWLDNAGLNQNELDIHMISLYSDPVSHLGTAQLQDVDDDSIPSLDQDVEPASVEIIQGKVCFDSLALQATVPPKTENLSKSAIILDSMMPIFTSPNTKPQKDGSCKKENDPSSNEIVFSCNTHPDSVSNMSLLLEMNDDDLIQDFNDGCTRILPSPQMAKNENVAVKLPRNDKVIVDIGIHRNPYRKVETNFARSPAFLGLLSTCSRTRKHAEQDKRRFSLPNLRSNDVSDGVVSLSFDKDASIGNVSCRSIPRLHMQCESMKSRSHLCFKPAAYLETGEFFQGEITNPVIASSKSMALLCSAAPEIVDKPLLHLNRHLPLEETEWSQYEIDTDISLPPKHSYTHIDLVHSQEAKHGICSIQSLQPNCTPLQQQDMENMTRPDSTTPQVKITLDIDDRTWSAVELTPVQNNLDPLESTFSATTTKSDLQSNSIGSMPLFGLSQGHAEDKISLSTMGDSSGESRCAHSPKSIGRQNVIQENMESSIRDDDSVPSLSSEYWNENDLENSLTPYKALGDVNANGEFSLAKVTNMDVTMSAVACGLLAAIVRCDDWR